jgi:cytosine/adenosine deaminase-related metal-dependent hydrolase
VTARRPAGPVWITARYILGHRDGRHCLLPGGEIVFEHGAIRFVGYDYPGEVAERHDFGNAIVTPGLIDLDALSDLDTTVLAFDNHPATRTGRVWPHSYMARGPYEMYAPDELLFQKRYAFQALLRNGITTALPIASLFYRAWGETFEEFAGAADIAEDLGLRIYLGPAYRTGNPFVTDAGDIELFFDEPRGLAGLQEAIRFCRTFEGRAGGRIRTMLAPDRIETCTPALLCGTATAGRELGVPVRLHCAQGNFEVQTVRRLHDRTPIEWLRDLGFLTDRTLLPHGTHVRPSRQNPGSGDDLAIILDAGAVIVHCPLVAARFGNALESVASFRQRGLRMGLGTDTAPADLMHNMQIGIATGRIAEGAADAVRAADYFDLATLGGADALGRPDLGRIEPGARADLAVFQLGLPHQYQVIDPIQTLMLTGRGTDARTVIVDGCFAMEDRVIPGVDEAEATIAAQAQFDRLVARYPDRTWKHPPVELIFTPSYPVIGRP